MSRVFVVAQDKDVTNLWDEIQRCINCALTDCGVTAMVKYKDTTITSGEENVTFVNYWQQLRTRTWALNWRGKSMHLSFTLSDSAAAGEHECRICTERYTHMSFKLWETEKCRSLRAKNMLQLRRNIPAKRAVVLQQNVVSFMDDTLRNKL